MDFDEKKEPKKKIQRKGKKPTRFKPVESTSRSVKAPDIGKTKGKRISHETDSDVQQKKKNTSGKKLLVIKKPVLESTSRPVKTLETESKRNGKRICLESDSDVQQKKKNTSRGKLLVIKESVLESTSRPVKTLETESKRNGKRICLESDSNVQQKKKNTSGGKLLVIKEFVPENLPITPHFKSDQINDRQDKPKSVKKPTSCSFGLVDCVKILRQLESSEHIDKDFRQRFLTWYSLKAKAEQTRVARTFIHAFKDDSEALADQLIDTFSDFISKKRSASGDGDGASSSGALFKKPRIN